MGLTASVRYRSGPKLIMGVYLGRCLPRSRCAQLEAIADEFNERS